MKQRNLIITGAVFLVLLVYVLFTQTGNKGFDTLHLPVLPKIKAADIDQITLVKPGEKIVLAKEGADWQILSPLKFLADKNKLDALRSLVEEARLTNVVSERPESLADFGLNSASAVSLQVRSPKKTLELVLGHADQSATHTYAQWQGDKKVYQVLGDFSQTLSRPAKEWRSLQIYDFSTDEVKSVTISRPNKPEVAFAKEVEAQAGIVQASPQKVTPPALPTRVIWKEKSKSLALGDPAVNQWLNNFTRLTAQTIQDETDWSGEPMATVKVETNKGQTYILEILKYIPKEQRYQVRKGTEAVIYEIGRYQGDNILKSAAELK